MKLLEKSPPIEVPATKSLVQIINDAEANKLINKIQEDYYYWDKVKYLPVPAGIEIKDIWSLVKFRRKNTPYQIKFGKYNFFWNMSSGLHGTLHFLDMNIGGSLESTSLINKEDKNRYLISSIMEEAIASSQIEGAVTTRKHAKDMLRKSTKPRNKSEQMILNNYITIKKILEIKSEPLNKENLLHIHKLVTSGTLSTTNEEGALRDNDEIKIVDVVDGNIVHIPPNHDELNELLNDLFKFFNEDDPNLFIHPIIKASILHFMIGFIHPFTDGNGRTSRAIFYWYLLKKQYWLVEYLSISRLILRAKAQYARAFQYTEIDDNDLTYFISYNLKTMKLSFEQLREYIRRKNEEKRQLTSFLGLDGLTYRQALILEWFIQDPSLLMTVKEAEKRLGVSNMSARIDLTQLLNKEYLDIKAMNKTMKAYVKGVKLDAFMNKTKARINSNHYDNNQTTLFS